MSMIKEEMWLGCGGVECTEWEVERRSGDAVWEEGEEMSDGFECGGMRTM